MTTDHLMLAFERARRRLALIEMYKDIINTTFDLAVIIARNLEDIGDIEELRAYTFAALETDLRAASAA